MEEGNEKESYNDYTANTDDRYVEDNGYNNEQMPTDIEGSNNYSSQIPANSGNIMKNFASGVKAGYNDAMGNNQKHPFPGSNKNKDDGKQDNIAKGTKNNKDDKKNNPALGQKNGDNNKNKMPKADKNNNNQNAKNGNPRNRSNNKSDKKEETKKDSTSTKNKNNGLGSRLRNSRKQGANKDKNAGKKKISQGIKALWTALPVTGKITIIVGGISIILVFALILFIAVMTGTGVAIGNAMCGEEGSSYSGSDYTGSANINEFLCKMQNPVGKGTVYLYGWVGEPRPGHTHAGVDLSINKNIPIYAAQSGTIDSAGLSGGYGNAIVIKHGNSGLYTRYGHLSKILVKKGDTVGKGQKIGIMGGTGIGGLKVYATHLHFELRSGNGWGTPLKEINEYFGYRERYHKTTGVSEKIKQQCGSNWDGEPAGDSANASNESGDYISTSTGSEGQCCDTSSSSSGSSGNYCSNGITVDGKTYSLDEYVAGVVSAENSYKDGDNIEASKAQAIAARTYAINRTNNCEKSIGNSQNAQVFTKAGEIGTNASNQTAGQVMLYNGNIFSSEYDCFCKSSGTATYQKIPSQETHVLKLNSKYTSKIAGGHCRGMSQLYSRQLQDEGKKYDEILRFFYANGVEITGASSNSCSIGGDGYNGKIWPFYQTDYNNAYCKAGQGTIASSGCGPTAMAMVVSSFLNEKHDPVELAKYSCSHNYRVSSGTAWGFFKSAGEKYGLTVKQVNSSKSSQQEVLAALNSGNKLVIAATNKQPFTNNGHFIVLVSHKDGSVFVQDPNKANDSKQFDFKTVSNASRQYWIISKG